MDTQRDAYTLRAGGSDTDFKLASNNNYRLFLSLDYEFIGVSYGFSPNFFAQNNDDKLKGKSSYNDLRFRFFLGQWVQGLQYTKIRGYYVENTQYYIDDWNEGIDPYIQISNLKNTTYGMSTSYVFNPEFSYRNVTYQTEWQKRSAGSFIPTLYYDYTKSGFKFESTESDENTFNIRLATSYYYTLVMSEHWFVVPFISPSLGLKFSKTNSTIDNLKSTENNTYVTRALEGGLQLGYSSNKVIFGGSFNFSANWYNEDKRTSIENDKLFGLLYVGYRFDTPTFVEKTFEKL